MEDSLPAKYKEVPLRQQRLHETKRKFVTVTCGGYPSTLVDLKTSDLSGGCKIRGKYNNAFWFVGWHTSRETICLSEKLLHRNECYREVNVTFKGSPILAVDIHRQPGGPFYLLIATTTSFHRIPIGHQESASYNEQCSALWGITELLITDPMNCYVFVNDIGPSHPVTAAAIQLCPESQQLKCAVASGVSRYLFTMAWSDDKPDVKCVELTIPYGLASFVVTLADSWRRKTSAGEVVAISFSAPSSYQSLLYTLHRDGWLRVWLACGRMLLAENVSRYAQGNGSEFHSCVMRQSLSYIGLFFSFTTYSTFVILEPEITYDEVTGIVSTVELSLVRSIFAPNCNLRDFVLSDQHVWSLWSDPEGNMQTLVCELAAEQEQGAGAWTPVVLDSMADGLPEWDGEDDMRDYYCHRIFQMGLFPDKAIRKTLKMFKRSVNDMDMDVPASGSIVRLKREVMGYIDAHMQQELAALNTHHGSSGGEKLVELSNRLWERFYRYCVQYSYELARPVGLFICPGDRLNVGLVRKQYVSFFRPCDPLEEALYWPLEQASAELPGPNDGPIAPGTLALVQLLVELQRSLTQHQHHLLDSFLHQQCASATLNFPAELVGAADTRSLAKTLVLPFLLQTPRLADTIADLLQWTVPGVRVSPEVDVCGRLGTEGFDVMPHAYCSDMLATELSVETARQVIEARYVLLRNLFLLQHLAGSLAAELPDRAVDPLPAEVQRRTELLLRSYQCMHWIAQTRVELEGSRMLELAAMLPMQQRTSLTLLEGFVICRMADKPEQWARACLLERAGIPYATLKDGGRPPAEPTVLDIAHMVMACIYPACSNFMFGDYLAGMDLHVQVDEYARLLDSWCQWNSGSRCFVRGKSYLTLGDTAKALDLFLASAHGVQSEEFLQQFLGQYKPNRIIESAAELRCIYFLKLARMCERYEAYDGMLRLVMQVKDEPLNPDHQAMFENIEFSSRMALCDYTGACSTLTKIGDPVRQKDCLRQLIRQMFALRYLDKLLELPFGHLSPDVADIVAHSARTTDVSDRVQYDFLFALHVRTGHNRDAANAKYEEAMRIYFEATSFPQFRRYYECLLTCVSLLADLKPEQRWVFRTATDAGQVGSRADHASTGAAFPQLQAHYSDADGDDDDDDNDDNDDDDEGEGEGEGGNAEVELVTYDELHEQFIIARCALELTATVESYRLVASFDAPELLAMLLRKKHYNLALRLAHSRPAAAPHSLVPAVFEHLAGSCLAVSSGEPGAGDATDGAWLHANCLPDVTVGRDAASTAWNYLRHLLQLERDRTEAHLAVLRRVVSGGASVPAWLTAWCFQYAPVQLVRCYLAHGRLEDAHESALELLRSRFFSAGRFTHQTAFPLSVLEQLHYELNQPTVKQPLDKDRIERYLKLFDAGF